MSSPVLGIGKRLRNLREPESRDTYGKRFNVSKNTVERYELEKSAPDANFIRAVCEYHDISTEWLLNGIAPKHRGSAVVMDTTANDGGIIQVPGYDATASMGGGFLNGPEHVIAYWPMTQDYLRSLGVAPQNAVVINTKGDSMSPTLEDDDKVLIDRGKRKEAVTGVYVVRLGDALFAKRLQWKADGTLLIKSDNPAYDTDEVKPENAPNLYIVGRVAARIGRM